MEILDSKKIREARRERRRKRRRQRRLIAALAFVVLLTVAFGISVMLWDDDGRRCAKEELVGNTEMCTRWETREGLHYQPVE